MSSDDSIFNWRFFVHSKITKGKANEKKQAAKDVSGTLPVLYVLPRKKNYILTDMLAESLSCWCLLKSGLLHFMAY